MNRKKLRNIHKTVKNERFRDDVAHVREHSVYLTDILKTTTVNGTVLAVTWWSSILPVAQLILIGVTIFWTCLKVAKALRDLRK